MSTESTDPIDLTKSADLTDPIDHTDPIDLTEPTDLTDPIDHTQPDGKTEIEYEPFMELDTYPIREMKPSRAIELADWGMKNGTYFDVELDSFATDKAIDDLQHAIDISVDCGYQISTLQSVKKMQLFENKNKFGVPMTKHSKHAKVQKHQITAAPKTGAKYYTLYTITSKDERDRQVVTDYLVSGKHKDVIRICEI